MGSNFSIWYLYLFRLSRVLLLIFYKDTVIMFVFSLKQQMLIPTGFKVHETYDIWGKTQNLKRSLRGKDKQCLNKKI